MPGARKKFRGKVTETEVKYQEQENNIGEKRQEQKQSARSKERK